MTALNLASADRTLTPPSSAFTTIAFGDVDFTSDYLSPHPVSEWNGFDAIPRTYPTGDWITSEAFTPTGDHALFIAIAGPPDDDGWEVVYQASNLDLNVYDAGVSNAEVGANGGFYPVASTSHDTGLTVYALVASSSETFVANSRDGVLATDSAASAASSAAMRLYSTDSPNSHILGMWMFESTTVSQADALDTIAAIAANYPAPVAASGLGGWAIRGTGHVTVNSTEFEPPTIPTPPKGGTQTPPAPPTPATPSEMAAAGVYPIRHVWETMPAPTLVDGRPVDWQPSASGNDEYAYLQIIANGTDITLYSGVETPFPSWRRGEPFGSQAATIRLPQITAFHTVPSWAKCGANVSIRLDIIGGSTVSLFEGFVMDVSAQEDSGVFTLECMGALFGADLQLRPPSFTTAPQDIGNLIPALLNAASSRRWLDMASVVTGIQSSVAGGWEPLLTGFIQELLATALDGSGRQWTVKCNERTPVLARKDTTTIADTIRTGQRGINIDLSSDASESPNVIYGEGINPDGGRWRNAKYPNWKPDDTPAYPNNDAGNTIHQGEYDSDTDSGDGISVMEAKLGLTVDGYYSAEDRAAVMRFQRRAGITVDGFVGPQTWAALFDTGANTGSLDGAFIAPLAAAEEVMPRLYGPDGDDLGPNPDFDPDVIRVERKVNYGQGVEKSRGIANAERVLARESVPGWQGVITYTLDPASKSRYELREGENLRVLGWQGDDIDLHIAQIRFDEDIAACEVDTKARDYPTLQAVMTRDRDAVDPARVAAKRLLAGQLSTDRATFDAESPAGRMPRHPLYAGLWDVRRMPMGSYGRIVRTVFRTTDSAEPFSLAVFGKPLTAAALTAVVGNPLTATENPWAEHGDELDSLGLLQAWGWNYQPAGYYPHQYSDPNGDTGASVTGRLEDDAGWDYASDQSPWLWVAMLAEDSCYIEGRFYGAPED